MQDNLDDDKLNEIGRLLHSFEADPPSDAWEHINHRMKKRKRIAIFRYSSIAASLIILLSVGAFLLNNSDQLSSPQADSTAVITDRPSSVNDSTDSINTGTKTGALTTAGNEIIQAENNSGNTGLAKSKNAIADNQVTNKSIASRSKKQTAKNSSQNEDSLNESSLLPGKLSGLTPTEESSISELSPIEDATITSDPSTVITQREFLVTLNPDSLKLYSPDVEYALNDNKYDNWAFSARYGFQSGTNIPESEQPMNPSRGSYNFDEFSTNLANNTGYFEEIKNLRHDAPITLGFTVSRDFAKRWALETGVLYTKLGYRVKTDDFSPFYREYRNQIHYLGVPAGIRFTFLSHRRFNLYSLQWVVLEKGVTGRSHIDTYTNNVITNSETGKHDIRGVQLSTITALGGEVKLAGSLNLFGQGGIQAFYLNKTQPFNIRSSKIAWPSVQAGIRLKLK